jgi:hypothetical protein
MHAPSSIIVASFVTSILAGCTMATDPTSTAEPLSTTPRAPDQTHAIAAASGDPDQPCVAPLTPTEGAWSCGGSGIRTGEKTATTTDGYTNNCAGRATIDVATPSCDSQTQKDEIYIVAVGLSTESSAACAASYLDYTIAGTSAASGVSSVLASGKAYGVFAGGYCGLEAPASYPVSAEWSALQISADAYQPASGTLTDGGVAATETVPVNVTFSVSFQ